MNTYLVFVFSISEGSVDAGGISASEAVRQERVVEQSHTETCHTGGHDRPSEPTSSGEVYHAASYEDQPCVCGQPLVSLPEKSVSVEEVKLIKRGRNTSWHAQRDAPPSAGMLHRGPSSGTVRMFWLS
jgi:hypothetical protein